jgi:hypothetical protein
LQNHQAAVFQLLWMHVGSDQPASALVSASVSAVEPQGAPEGRAEVESGREETAAEEKEQDGPAALTHPSLTLPSTPRYQFLHLLQAIPWLIAARGWVIGSKLHCVSPPPSPVVLDGLSLELPAETSQMGGFEPWPDSWAALCNYARVYPWIGFGYGENHRAMIA